MNWHNKIKSLIREEDNSPELRKGDIKEILIEKFANQLPSFEFSSYRNCQYNFQRTRTYKELTVLETLHVLYSLKEKNFSCSVSSLLNPGYLKSKSYNNGFINPHVDLITLKKGTRVLPVEEAYYFSNGRLQTTTIIIEQICYDYVAFGLPFLDAQFHRLQNNQIIIAGLEFIQQLSTNKEELKEQIEKELKKIGYSISRLSNPVYLSLKEHLQSIRDQTKEDRQNIPRLAFELLELYNLASTK